MPLITEPIANRDKLVLIGLYLAKYDTPGLERLGFGSFVEAFNVLGYALGARPASIKNYRDEFDPLFPNARKGWHKRPVRAYCRALYEEFKGLDLDSFTRLLKSFWGSDQPIDRGVRVAGELNESESSFAKRLITGLAAEEYFALKQPTIPEFKGYVAENTTRHGCGYDFRLRADGRDNFLAVEVKGMKEKAGSLSLTSKEYDLARVLKDRFYLFVVKNFEQSPYHEIFQDPLSGQLEFKKTERVIVHVSWQTIV